MSRRRETKIMRRSILCTYTYGSKDGPVEEGRMRPKMFVPLHPKAGDFAGKVLDQKFGSREKRLTLQDAPRIGAPTNSLTTFEQRSSQDELSNESRSQKRQPSMY